MEDRGGMCRSVLERFLWVIWSIWQLQQRNEGMRVLLLLPIMEHLAKEKAPLKPSQIMVIVAQGRHYYRPSRSPAQCCLLSLVVRYIGVGVTALIAYIYVASHELAPHPHIWNRSWSKSLTTLNTRPHQGRNINRRDVWLHLIPLRRMRPYGHPIRNLCRHGSSPWRSSARFLRQLRKKANSCPAEGRHRAWSYPEDIQGDPCRN